MRVRGARADDFDDGTYGYIGGHADGMDLPFELTEEEYERLAAEHAAKLAKKKPCGFAPWPDDAPL